jgi:ornithine cyclodeaminase/alanine dehydrogenase-like protein (mu-crystallin family)
VSLRLVNAQELVALLPMEAAIDALERAFGGPQLPLAPERSHLEVEGGTLLLMPASGPEGVGVKLVTVAPGNPERGLPLVQAVYVLFDGETLSPVAIIDGAVLTAIRTGAVSGVATRYLAREDASRLVIFGAGTQARAHLDAMRAVRDVTILHVVSRTRERAEALVDRARTEGLEAAAADPSAVADADIICTCTTSREPLFDGSLLSPGAHVNAVGAFEPDARELDDATVRRGRLVVETREAALAEAGDLVIPMIAGVIREADIVAELSEVVQGKEVRRSSDDVTVFKSVGVAFEDLVVARAVLDRDGSAGCGRADAFGAGRNSFGA